VQPLAGPSRLILDRDGLRLGCLDFGGTGPAVVLLHGLAGHAGEWGETATWASRDRRVIALDARGHGASERGPSDVSPAACVADVAFAIEALELGRVVLVGQSLGGVTALLVAARHAGLVRALVVAEAGPAGEDEASVAAIVDVLAAWPVPFASRVAALAFFGGPSPAASAWVAGLEERDGGLWPRFDLATLSRMLRLAASRSYWEDWDRIDCPTLVVRAGDGTLSRREAETMIARHPRARLVELEGASHDVHIDDPDGWRTVLGDFLDSLA
jgi:pimeloyl-ACP methyl ester carboxylesterase